MSFLGLVLLGATAYKMNQADNNNEEADRVNAKAFNRMGEARRAMAEKEKATRDALLKLSNRKKGIMQSGLKKFLAVYERIIRIRFEEKELSQEITCNALAPLEVDRMRQMVSVAGITMTDNQLMRSMLLALGTGIVFGVADSIVKDSENNLKVASMRKRQANAAAEYYKNGEAALTIVQDRADKMTDLLTRMNTLFIKTIKHTEQLIDEKGDNRSNYTKEDREHLMTCMNFASAVKKLLDTPLFDEDGEVSQALEETLRTSEAYMHQIQSGNR